MKLYHVTTREAVPSILKNGLLVSHYGEIHGSMEIHPPEPAIYLSRKPESDNLHTDLVSRDTATVMVDSKFLDTQHIYPDDWFLEWAVENIDSVDDFIEMGLPESEARRVFISLEAAYSDDIADILKPLWRYYLELPSGGEISYVRDIPPHAISLMTGIFEGIVSARGIDIYSF